ncbi:hypothetical protein PIB30_071227 [Stylosanthes scabra]|uniref:Uncharacterized protein n=1 Tax=Stylosanthes scabra TaxID=79078 RepID=A0ABU6QNA5_9FABA|nr:hypothetical protein [Stylosanthes scabra]
MQVEPPPQSHPMAKFFINLADFNNYIMNFAQNNTKNGDKPSEDWKYDRNEACRFFNLDPNCGNKMPTNPMSDEHRLLHYLLVWDGPTTSGLGYVILWTIIFKYFNIDLSNTLQKGLKGPNCINYATLRQTGRGLAQIESQPQPAPQDHQEYQAGPSEQSSEQPSMRDLMQAIQSMELNMGNRLERIEQNQTRMTRRIRRMEQYIFSKDEGDDDDEDQD